eukprot:350000-Chlamydomonas_euryale.AAC.2
MGRETTQHYPVYPDLPCAAVSTACVKNTSIDSLLTGPCHPKFASTRRPDTGTLPLVHQEAARVGAILCRIRDDAICAAWASERTARRAAGDGRGRRRRLLHQPAGGFDVRADAHGAHGGPAPHRAPAQGVGAA